MAPLSQMRRGAVQGFPKSSPLSTSHCDNPALAFRMHFARKAAGCPNKIPSRDPTTDTRHDALPARQYRGGGGVSGRGADRQPGAGGTALPDSARTFLRTRPPAGLRTHPDPAGPQCGGDAGHAETLFRSGRGAEGTGRDHLSRAADRRRAGPAGAARTGRTDLRPRAAARTGQRGPQPGRGRARHLRIRSNR